MSTRVRPSTNIFLRTLAANPWTLPKLEALDLTSVHFHDNDFAQLLRQMRKLKSLKVSHTRFGRLSLLEMVKKRARHGTTGDGTGTTYTLCDSVTLLHLDDFPEVTGAMIQTLLASCPKLEVFLGGKVKVSEIAIGDEWVCKGVLHLCLYLEADEDYHAPPVSREFLNNQRNVFARLGRLTNLQGLQLTREWDDLNPTQVMQTLDLRLPAGMKSLANLKELEYLCFFHDCGQRTGLREVRWMVQHWPKLECVAGMTMIDDQTQARMAAVLDPAGVEF
ncbi:hypothetical protein BGZ58_009306 [Dissophora ornata]|nr:hypothetical protein BGZ58_009306 [Dissophora ornata]